MPKKFHLPNGFNSRLEGYFKAHPKMRNSAVTVGMIVMAVPTLISILIDGLRKNTSTTGIEATVISPVDRQSESQENIIIRTHLRQLDDRDFFGGLYQGDAIKIEAGIRTLEVRVPTIFEHRTTLFVAAPTNPHSRSRGIYSTKREAVIIVKPANRPTGQRTARIKLNDRDLSL